MPGEKRTINPYLDYQKSGDIHGTVLYPAVMIAPFQRDILSMFVGRDSTVSICDPFVGSGTSLYEAASVAPHAHLYGSDINPLAVLISEVKLEGVDETVVRDIEQVECVLRSDVFPSAFEFPGSGKWYKPEVFASLVRVRDAIMQVDSRRNRRFFWLMMTDVIRKYGNSRSSTYKLHLREQAQIDRIADHVIDDYVDKIRGEYQLFLRNDVLHGSIHYGDSVTYLNSFEDERFDITITSPPYGDNNTTVPYGEYSVLALRWFDAGDLNLEGWELVSNKAIDARSLGGCRCEHGVSKDSYPLDEAANDVIATIAQGKRGKVERFLRGYYEALDQMCRTTKSTLILTLGNRTVDGRRIDLVDLTSLRLRDSPFRLSDRIEREIRNKRTPTKVSRVDGSPVPSMRSESVLIFSRER